MATPKARNWETVELSDMQVRRGFEDLGGQAGGLWIRTKIAHTFPQSPLSACLWLSHSPCLLSFPNSLLRLYIGPLGLFMSLLTTSLSSTISHPLINRLWLSAWLAICLPNSICFKERVWPCWSVGVTRNAGWWISRWCSGSARHQFQGHTRNEGKDAITLRRAQQQWLIWPSSSRLSFQKEQPHPDWPVNSYKQGCQHALNWQPIKTFLLCGGFLPLVLREGREVRPVWFGERGALLSLWFLREAEKEVCVLI